jgi:hypothetical protein
MELKLNNLLNYNLWFTMSLVSLELPVACPSTKGVPKSELTNLLVGWMQIQMSN